MPVYSTHLWFVHLSYYQVSGVFLVQATSTVPPFPAMTFPTRRPAAKLPVRRQSGKMPSCDIAWSRIPALSEASPRQKNHEKSGMVCPPLLVLDMEKKKNIWINLPSTRRKRGFLVTTMVTVNMINYQYRFGVVGFGNTFGMNWHRHH